MIVVLLLSSLIPVAAVAGWWIGRSRRQSEFARRFSALSRQYFVALNYLLDEQPDKGVDIFIKLVEVDHDTVETHLALGSLFRRRGEVDRAIKVHQNLVARPQLSQAQRVLALLALGRDYMSAGVLDRAEQIFREIVSIDLDYVDFSLKHLLDIYQQEKAWAKATTAARKLQAFTQASMAPIIAHHYCELATLAIHEREWDVANRHLTAALDADKLSVRASFLLAQMAEQKQDFAKAITYYQQVQFQDPDFISDAVRLMAHCYQQTDNANEFMAYLQSIVSEHPRTVVVLCMAESMAQTRSPTVAADFVTEQLRINPSLKGLQYLISWHLQSVDGKVRDKLDILNDVTTRLLEDLPVYRCQNCGFSGRTLHWLCPGCKQWSTTKPVHGLQGD